MKILFKISRDCVFCFKLWFLCDCIYTSDLVTIKGVAGWSVFAIGVDLGNLECFLVPSVVVNYYNILVTFFSTTTHDNTAK